MCVFGSIGGSQRPVIAAADNAEASREAALARALQRRRAGVSANILTSPSGIAAPRPMTARLGAPA